MKPFLIKIIFSVLIVCFFTFPLLQTKYHFIREVATFGVEQPVPKPVMTLQSIKSGEFQQKFDQWFSQNFGLKSYFIRTNNQLYYSIFKQTPPTCQVIIGRDGALLEGSYISEYLNSIAPLDATVLETKVKDIKALQDALKKRGKTFLLLITPSKVAIYPELIPQQLQNFRINTTRNYDLLIPLLDKYGINYVDGHKITKEQKSQSQYAMFPKGGTHWNYLAAYYTTEKAISKLESLSGSQMTHIALSSITVDKRPVGTDRDLANLINVWVPPVNYSSPRPVLTPSTKGNETKPTIFMEGASFSEQFINTLKSCSVFKTLDLYFYFHTHIRYDEGIQDGKVLGEVVDVNWENNVFNHDIIIVEMNEQNISKIQKGFIQDALANLK